MDITLGGVTTLEVTSCFPMPLQTDAEDAEEGNPCLKYICFRADAVMRDFAHRNEPVCNGYAAVHARC